MSPRNKTHDDLEDQSSGSFLTAGRQAKKIPRTGSAPIQGNLSIYLFCSLRNRI